MCNDACPILDKSLDLLISNEIRIMLIDITEPQSKIKNRLIMYPPKLFIKNVVPEKQVRKFVLIKNNMTNANIHAVIEIIQFIL